MSINPSLLQWGPEPCLSVRVPERRQKFALSRTPQPKSNICNLYRFFKIEREFKEFVEQFFSIFMVFLLKLYSSLLYIIWWQFFLWTMFRLCKVVQISLYKNYKSFLHSHFKYLSNSLLIMQLQLKYTIDLNRFRNKPGTLSISV